MQQFKLDDKDVWKYMQIKNDFHTVRNIDFQESNVILELQSTKERPQDVVKTLVKARSDKSLRIVWQKDLDSFLGIGMSTEAPSFKEGMNVLVKTMSHRAARLWQKS